MAKDDDGKPAEVPELILETEDEARRIIEAIVRKYIKRNFNQEMQHVKNNFDINRKMSGVWSRCSFQSAIDIMK